MDRAKKAVSEGTFSSEYEYFRALVWRTGPEYYDWKPIASRLLLETMPPDLPPVVRPWVDKKKKRG